MKKYQVLIEETLARNIVIEANSDEEADEIVTALYNQEHVVLDDSDCDPNNTIIGGEYTYETDDEVDFTREKLIELGVCQS